MPAEGIPLRVVTDLPRLAAKSAEVIRGSSGTARLLTGNSGRFCCMSPDAAVSAAESISLRFGENLQICAFGCHGMRCRLRALVRVRRNQYVWYDLNTPDGWRSRENDSGGVVSDVDVEFLHHIRCAARAFCRFNIRAARKLLCRRSWKK